MAETGNGANTAGGLSGKNSSAPAATGADAAKASRQAGGPSAGAATPTGGGVYRDSVPTDMANRAASQQTTQQMTAQRLRADALRSCYVERGYQEFTLTDEQRAHLASLEKGSNEYLQYLSDIATDPALLDSKVAVAPQPGS